jgi:hypothetical protein
MAEWNRGALRRQLSPGQAGPCEQADKMRSNLLGWISAEGSSIREYYDSQDWQRWGCGRFRMVRYVHHCLYP